MRLHDFENDPDGRRRREREREIYVMTKVAFNKLIRSWKRLLEEVERARERNQRIIDAHQESKERDGPDA